MSAMSDSCSYYNFALAEVIGMIFHKIGVVVGVVADCTVNLIGSHYYCHFLVVSAETLSFLCTMARSRHGDLENAVSAA